MNESNMRICLQLSKLLHSRLQALADKKDLSVSACIRLILANYLDSLDKDCQE